MNIERGWKARRAAADARRVDRAAAWSDDRSNVRRQRAEMQEQARVRDAETAAETERKRLLNRVSCPCCSGREDGLSVAHAELLIRAVSQLPEGSRVDAEILAALHAVAEGHNVGWIDLPARGDFKVAYPRPVAAPEPAEVVESTETAEAEKPAKAARRHTPPPFIEG